MCMCDTSWTPCFLICFSRRGRRKMLTCPSLLLLMLQLQGAQSAAKIGRNCTTASRCSAASDYSDCGADSFDYMIDIDIDR